MAEGGGDEAPAQKVSKSDDPADPDNSVSGDTSEDAEDKEGEGDASKGEDEDSVDSCDPPLSKTV